MREDAPRAVEEKDPARGVEQREQAKQANIEKPQRPRGLMQPRNGKGKLVQRQRKAARAHGRGEPVRRELAHHLAQAVRPRRGERPRQRLKGQDFGHHRSPSIFRRLFSAPDLILITN